MSRPKAASRAAASNVAASLAALLSPARAEASRRNGARSKGPKTPEGKARASRNALKHGLCAGHHVVVDGESAEAFAAFEAALLADLAPAGALQTLLAGRIARAAWRLERAERIEAELFARQMEGVFGDGDLGLALIRDGNGARVRHAAALPRRRPGRACPHAAHAQDAPGRSAGTRAAHAGRATERTQRPQESWRNRSDGGRRRGGPRYCAGPSHGRAGDRPSATRASFRCAAPNRT
jgi:hypothetical protein